MKYLLKFLRLIGIRSYRTFRLTLRAIALIFGLAAAFYVSMLMEQQDFISALFMYLIVCITAFIEFVLADVLADRSFPFDTERKLILMEKRLGASAIATIAERLNNEILQLRGCNKALISGTVHILAELSSTSDQRVRVGLLQLTDYVGPDGGKKGRVTLITQGIIGRCARTGRLESVDFADDAEYHSAMIRDFGFTKDEADQHTKSARSYLAYPLMLDGKLVGVLYFFTTEPQVFPRAVNPGSLNGLASEIVNYMKIAQLV